jgi:hypothetical protein
MAMPLIEEKIGFGFDFVYPDKRCARCVNFAPVARNVSRHGRNENRNAGKALHNLEGSDIENKMVPFYFHGDQEPELEADGLC